MTAKEYLIKWAMENSAGNENLLPENIISIMESYAELKCKEQRGICAEVAQAYIGVNDEPLVSRGSILNARLPK